MGKRVKKKATRNAQKEKQFSTSSPKNVSQKIVPTLVVDGVSAVKDARVCPHLDTSINLDKVSLKIASLESLKCDDCRDGVVDRRASKVKGKHGKKASGSASESKSIWVCLECGHLTCGGVGLPTTPQSHATHHARQKHHPLAVQFANPNLRWCFSCNTLIPVQISKENGEQKDALSDAVKLLKSWPSSENSVDVEDVWFGGGGVTSEIKSVGAPVSSENSGGYTVKGLVNLGNTCFFNSILQNLLAMDKLRDYFLRLEEPIGSLSISLKKLFLETNPSSTSVKNVINPQSLFNSVCAMAPQFRGYQQQDSHELLRFLLDGICNEESGVKNCASSSERDSIVPKHTPTFVDAMFGGQTSSTVSCLECGHTSTVYEPYLDLSLPLPTKKSPSKSMPSRSRKQKPPPKRRGKFVMKINSASNASPADDVPIPTIANTSDSLHAEKKVVPSDDSTQPESVFLCGLDDKNVSDAQENVAQGNVTEKISQITVKEPGISSDNLRPVDNVEPATVLNGHGNQAVDSSDILSWLDYLEPTTVSSDDMVTEFTSKTHLAHDDEALLFQTMEASKQIDSRGSEETPPLADDSWLDYLEPSSLSNSHIMALQNEDSAEVQNPGIDNDVFWENEQPLKAQESEIIFLPYEELPPTSNGNQATSSSVGYEQEPSDFDGFGGLFDEPEVVSGPTVGPFLNGPTARNISESDSDEVDNTDSQVSVDKCLTYFTTSELLTKTEHAWQCEQCSKALLEQRVRLKNKLQEPVSNGVIEYSLCNGVRNSDEISLLDDKRDCSRVASGLAESGNVLNGTSPELSQNPSLIPSSSEESCVIQNTDSCEINKPADECKNEKVERRVSNRLARRRDFNGIEDEEVNSGSVKVIRDASKRILIDRAPPILTIHLKRLSQDARGRLSKLNGHVDFKDTIDLKPYMDPSCYRDGGAFRYRLIGVVEHLGTMRGGHYVAYVRGGAKGNNDDDCLWYHASDAHVREVSLEEVLRCEAYILFYEQM